MSLILSILAIIWIFGYAETMWDIFINAWYWLFGHWFGSLLMDLIKWSVFYMVLILGILIVGGWYEQVFHDDAGDSPEEWYD